MRTTNNRKSNGHWIALAATVAFGLSTGCVTIDESTVDESTVDESVADGEHPNTDVNALQQLRKQVASSAGIVLDLSDDQHYNAVMHRLTTVGKTKSNSPYLFRRLEEMRKNGSDYANKSTALEGVGHFFEEVVTDNTANDYSATAFGTFPGGTVYTYIDSGVYDEDWLPLGGISQTEFAEEFLAGTEVRATSAGSFHNPNTEIIICIRADSLKCMEFDTGVDEDGDGNNELGFECMFTSQKLTCQTPKELIIEEPHNEPKGDTAQEKVITVCLDRDWLTNAYDCEHSMINTGGRLKMPLKGEAEFSRTISTSAVVDDAGVTKQVPTNGNASFSLSLPGYGGTCEAELQTDFWLHANTRVVDGVKANSKVVWDIAAADFGSRCFRHQEKVYFHMSLRVHLPFFGWQQVFITPNTAFYENGSEVFPRIRFAYSCFAEGTKITMSSGQGLAIEDVSIDQQMRTHTGQPMRVLDTSIGVERQPMVRIVDDAGHELLITEGHPLITEGRQIRAAGMLKVGDRVITDSGVTTLVQVAREDYDGHVYNVLLDGNHDGSELINGSSSTLFANGFLAGDASLQNVSQAALSQDQNQRLQNVPQQWQKDYVNSAIRQGLNWRKR